MELKRGHEWLTDSSNSELFSNKSRAVECADAGIGMGVPQINLSGWGNSLVSGLVTDRLFGPENLPTANPVAGNMSTMDGQSVEGRNDVVEQYNNASTFGLSHTAHDSSSSYNSLGGIRKVKVNQVNDFKRSIQEPMTQFYGEGIPRSLDMGPLYSRNQNYTISLGQSGSSGDKSFGFAGPVFSKAGGSITQDFSKDGVGLMPMSDIYDKGDGNVLPTSQTFQRGGDNFVLMGQSFQKMDDNLFLMSPSCNRGQESFMSILTSYGKAAENLFSDPSVHKDDANVLSMGPSLYKPGGEMTFMLPNQDSAGQNNVPFTQLGGSNTISFGGFRKENMLVSSSSITNVYESIGNTAETFKDSIQKETQENVCRTFSSVPVANLSADTIPKTKESKTSKKAPTNTFPSNVKSLLSTGMLDGVPVKYYSWSREKHLNGIIKGTGYLCGCSECKMTKVLNAYEFERHANCKTKHPNNHIYFENGKTIYAVVQELKNTPQEMLFDVIQNVTGSEINHKNFNTWKASFQAASRELQRIYGTDGVTLTS